MKRWKKILLIVLLVLLAAAVGILAWQRDNVAALYTALTTDQETILQNMEKSKQELENSIKSYNITIVPPNKEQNEALLNGTASADEIKEELGLDGMDDEDDTSSDQDVSAEPVQSPSPGQDAPEEPVQSAVPGESQNQEDQSQENATQNQASALVEKCIAELYICQVDLMAQLGSMKQQALDQWNRLDASQQTIQKLQEIGLDGLMKCYDLEVAADQKIKNILDKYRTQLEEIGADTSILDTMWKYYSDEKAAQKAYYINKYFG